MDLLETIKTCGEVGKSKGFWSADAGRAAKIIVNNLAQEITDAALIERLAEKITESLATHGLVPDPVRSIALMITELAEGIEGFRKDQHTGKDGLAEELADTTIRIFDFVCRFGPNLGFPPEKWLEIMLAKIEKNKMRPYLHGKKF